MAASPAPDDGLMEVASHRGPYRVRFDSADGEIARDAAGKSCFLADERVCELYPQLFAGIEAARLVTMEATEPNKSLTMIPALAERFLNLGLRRDGTLVVIGGGITQDVGCFLASVLMRGVSWKFYPTTLLAQADSCIGSKSSINVGTVKNSAGTFWPPRDIIVDRRFLRTLPDVEMRSGIGEIIKVHIIDGPSSFARLAADYVLLQRDAEVLERAIRRSLEIKRRIIEQDEFDAGPRQVLNYGHTFGHAIESATDYAIPHGIAVTIGMDMANYVAERMGRLARAQRVAMREVLDKNSRGFERTVIPAERLFAAIRGDKKASSDSITVIVPNGDGVPERVRVQMGDDFFGMCRKYLSEERA